MTNISRWLLAEVERLRAERDTYREALRALVEATEEQWRVTRCLPPPSGTIPPRIGGQAKHKGNDMTVTCPYCTKDAEQDA